MSKNKKKSLFILVSTSPISHSYVFDTNRLTNLVKQLKKAGLLAEDEIQIMFS